MVHLDSDQIWKFPEQPLGESEHLETRRPTCCSRPGSWTLETTSRCEQQNMWRPYPADLGFVFAVGGGGDAAAVIIYISTEAGGLVNPHQTFRRVPHLVLDHNTCWRSRISSVPRWSQFLRFLLNLLSNTELSSRNRKWILSERRGGNADRLRGRGQRKQLESLK